MSEEDVPPSEFRQWPSAVDISDEFDWTEEIERNPTERKKQGHGVYGQVSIIPYGREGLVIKEMFNHGPADGVIDAEPHIR